MDFSGSVAALQLYSCCHLSPRVFLALEMAANDTDVSDTRHFLELGTSVNLSGAVFEDDRSYLVQTSEPMLGTCCALDRVSKAGPNTASAFSSLDNHVNNDCLVGKINRASYTISTLDALNQNFCRDTTLCP